MSLDQSAIQEITNTAITASAVNILDLEQADFKAVIIPEDAKIQTLEKLQQYRNRFIGCMKTNSIEDFVTYSTSTKNESVKCFVSHESMSAMTFFNIGDEDKPGHADNTALLDLKATSEFISVLKLNDNAVSQKTLAEWLEDWRSNIVAFDADDNAIDFKVAVNAIRKLTIESSRKSEHEVSDMKASRSLLENVEAKSTEGLPAYFTFMCTPYHGLAVRVFTLRLSVLTGGDEPRFKARIVQLEAIEEQITEEFKNLLVGKFEGSEVKTFIGKFSLN
ncbi:DUF2303 family protein [Budviciaceae bacterium CWB-B4]|uniref:DUF2303 family protein n=1 Tax=Limnobaculum xujianqingii TaxID=2738837 RepID=A0A9D7AMD7_9GAMM|nr:DUF2303 family protein [Limnobaculum xujianqingii]MBK5075170.1 DUF2303 family protein [Limnobaculum xujianqingii]MBK5178482.1 DUF2303 family protein [Limnobaculum xujianqingii]